MTKVHCVPSPERGHLHVRTCTCAHRCLEKFNLVFTQVARDLIQTGQPVGKVANWPLEVLPQLFGCPPGALKHPSVPFLMSA